MLRAVQREHARPDHLGRGETRVVDRERPRVTQDLHGQVIPGDEPGPEGGHPADRRGGMQPGQRRMRVGLQVGQRDQVHRRRIRRGHRKPPVPGEDPPAGPARRWARMAIRIQRPPGQARNSPDGTPARPRAPVIPRRPPPPRPGRPPRRSTQALRARRPGNGQGGRHQGLKYPGHVTKSELARLRAPVRAGPAGKARRPGAACPPGTFGRILYSKMNSLSGWPGSGPASGCPSRVTQTGLLCPALPARSRAVRSDTNAPDGPRGSLLSRLRRCGAAVSV